MRYISTTDTAALIRKALKARFPDVTFSVRSKSYSGGSSIRVNWTDGPTRRCVSAVTAKFEGSHMNMMEDLKEPQTGELNGEPVRFSADFVFTDRTLSDAAELYLIAQLERTELNGGTFERNKNYARPGAGAAIWGMELFNRLENATAL